MVHLTGLLIIVLNSEGIQTFQTSPKGIADDTKLHNITLAFERSALSFMDGTLLAQ